MAPVGVPPSRLSCPRRAPPRPARWASSAQARVPAMRSLISYNRQFSYDPDWGLLGRTRRARPVRPAIGPGAAIALARRTGQVASYQPGAHAASRSELSRCDLTVVDLGALPPPAAGGASMARARAVRAADRAAGKIIAAAPARTIIAVAGLGDDAAPHLRAIMVSGPGFHDGLLAAPSTRQPGLVVITDLTTERAGLARPAGPGRGGGRVADHQHPPRRTECRGPRPDRAGHRGSGLPVHDRLVLRRLRARPRAWCSA